MLRVKGKDTEPVGDDRGGRDRRRGEARPHAHRRHAVVAREAVHAGADRLSPAHRCRWPSSRRRRPTWTSSAQRSTGSWRRTPASASSAQAETGEQLLWAQGESHIAVIVERLKRKFGAAVVTRPPRIPYRETIRGQDEGRGPAQEADRRARPVRPRLAGDRAQPGCRRGVRGPSVVGGSVPRQFWAGVEKGVRDVAEKGPIAGYPVIDFKATLYDGSFHTVDSDELSFRLAGQLATRKGIQDASPVLLEPIMDVEVRVPEAYMGDVNRDLNTRRGRVLGMDTADGMQVVRAHVPQAELFNYATELRSLSGGRGMFTAALAHYEEVPPHVAQKVIEAHKKDETAAH